MQQFISADIDREAIMNDVLLNFQSRGKVKVAMRKAFQDMMSLRNGKTPCCGKVKIGAS